MTVFPIDQPDGPDLIDLSLMGRISLEDETAPG